MLQNILDPVGNTPLLTLKKLALPFPDITLLVKAEHLNPSGSVKDRACPRHDSLRHPFR